MHTLLTLICIGLISVAIVFSILQKYNPHA